ncbi:alanine dehydrogenase [Egicoccus halophilus]|uniref:Alanine dehydrogenase n=1 Tax=Egicoccus halophilus TaxID=1670830 RepID=A0A8J3ETJ8_9ACTN|nr:alanine dehydrogenase [Egicoccus halophilus]GGI04060.1 alanine dehydrogenase [Egicoccus halophilus]
MSETRTIGVPSETKDRERRVSLTPSAVASVVDRGHRVLVQAGAGTGAGFDDDAYTDAGAELVADAGEVWAAEVVVKVKEPQPDEFAFFRDDLTLFTYLHLAAEPELTRALVESGIHAYAYETLTDRTGLPLLAPMSEIAGRAAAIVGAEKLSAAQGGSGTLMGGAAGVPPAKAVVIGLGVAGTMAARGLRGLDAHVTGVDVDLQRLYEHHLDGTVDATQISEPAAVAAHVREADLVVGAALVPGARAPVVVDEQMVASMRPGSVVVDLAIDQGGCIATARPTSLSEPTYVEHGVVHYCVTNVPGQFPRTASAALSAAVTPRLLQLVTDPDDASLSGALNVADGALVHPVVAETFPDLPRA